MCRNMSLKLTEERVLFLPNSDSHLEICEAFKLKDEKLGADRDHMSIEVIPLVSLESTDPNEWGYSVDTDRPYPAWYVEEIDKARVMTVAMELIADGRYLKWTGNVSLRGCSGLTALPVRFNPQRNADLSGCSGLTALPVGFNPRGDVSLRDCSGLTALPVGFNPRGDVSLSGCSGLTALPVGFNPRGYVYLYGCKYITDEMVATLTNARSIYRDTAIQGGGTKTNKGK